MVYLSSLNTDPPGEYELIAWHPALGLQRRSVQVTAEASIEVNFAFSMK